MNGLDLAMRIVEILAWPAVVVCIALVLRPRKQKPPTASTHPDPPPGWHYDPVTGVSTHVLRRGRSVVTYSVETPPKEDRA